MKALSYFVVLVMCLLTPRTQAQTRMSAPVTWKQTWDVGVWTGEAIGVSLGSSDSNASLTMAGFDVSRVMRRSWAEGNNRPTLEYVFEATPLFLVTKPQTVYGGGFSPLGIRWSFADKGRYQPYLQWNGGGMFTRSDVPPGRTASFNFTTSIGPGVMFRMHHNQALSVGVRLWHLSNARKGHTNPSFNTVQVVIGYHWLKNGLLR